ncbi:protease complex subunit PrcB family protein [Pseudothermotoga sp.]
MRLTIAFLLCVSSVVLAMIYYTPVAKVLPNEVYEWVGTKSANFQYMVLSYEPDLVLLVKGWTFSPVSVPEEYVFKIVIESDDFTHEIRLNGERSGIYIYMPQHLFVLPPNTRSLNLNGFVVEIPKRCTYSTKQLSRGGIEPGVHALDQSMSETRVLERGQKVFLRVDAGQKNTGGYSVKIDEVRFAGRRIYVRAHVESPQPGAMVTQAITYPSAVIEIQEQLEPGSYVVKCVLIDRNVEQTFEVEFEVR